MYTVAPKGYGGLRQRVNILQETFFVFEYRNLYGNKKKTKNDKLNNLRNLRLIYAEYNI